MHGNSSAREDLAPLELLPSVHGKAASGLQALHETWKILLRRRWFVLGCALLLAVAGWAGILALTPIYSATASVLIDDHHLSVTKPAEPVPFQPDDTELVQSQIQVMQSRKLLGRVVDKLALDANPLFNPNLKPKSGFSVGTALRYTAEHLGLGGLLPAKRPAPTLEEVRVKAVDEILRRLSVAQVGKSRAIKLDFSFPDAAIAAGVVNTIADLYVTSRLQTKFEEHVEAAKWLNDRLAELKDQVKASDTAVDEFRRSAQLTGSAAGTPAAQQLTDLNQQLVTARAARALAESNLQQARARINGSSPDDAISTVLQSPIVQQLAAQESDVARRLANLKESYGDRHPKVLDGQAELAEVHRRLQQEEQKVIAGMANDLSAARSREASLQQAVAQAQSELAHEDSASIKLRALQTEAAANHALLDAFLQRAKEISPDRTFEATDAEVISRAEIPDRPSFPKYTLMFAAALVAALAASASAALGLERMDDRIRSADQVEQLGATPLGMLPMANGARLRAGSVSKVLSEPLTAYSESLLGVYTALKLSNVDRPAKTVLLTSSFPGEGKTTLAVSLGRVLARSGQKVLVVDCDLRRSSLHGEFGSAQEPGLSDVLAGDARPDDAIGRDEESSAMILPAGRKAPNPHSLLSSGQFKSLLKEMAGHFDMIIIDSPPVFAVSDAAVLSALADKTVYVVRWGETRRKAVVAGLRKLRDVGADLAGIVLTAVDVDKHASYGFTDSGLYTRRFRSYYAS